MEVKSLEPARLELSAEALDLQARARRFVEEIVIPLEEEAEALGGKLPDEKIAAVERAAVEACLDGGGMHAVEHGGQGWTRIEWCLVEEQFGRTTNAIHWYVPQAYNVWAHASDEHIDRYLRPALRGELKDAYAVTERDAGSDPSQIAAVAERTDAGFRISGEKWFVTGGDHAAVYVVMANLVDGADRLPALLFVVDAGLDGIEIVDNPAFTHNYPDGHPTIRFNEVEVADTDVIGGIGGGDDVQRSWFTEERLGIAARCCGAIWRLLDETVAWTTAREQGGARVFDHQGVSFPLADSAADGAAGRLLTFAVAELADADAGPEDRPPQGLDGKAVHERGRLPLRRPRRAGVRRTRVHALEASPNGCCGELRVDRIWEGTRRDPEADRVPGARAGVASRGSPLTTRSISCRCSSRGRWRSSAPTTSTTRTAATSCATSSGPVRRAPCGASTRSARRSSGASARRASPTCPSRSTAPWSRSRPRAWPRSSGLAPSGDAAVPGAVAGFAQVELPAACTRPS